MAFRVTPIAPAAGEVTTATRGCGNQNLFDMVVIKGLSYLKRKFTLPKQFYDYLYIAFCLQHFAFKKWCFWTG